LKIIIFTNSQRGILCIDHIKNKFNINKVITSNEFKKFINPKIFLKYPKDINSSTFIKKIKNLNPDVIVSAGFSKIFSNNFIKSLNCLCLNLHAGSLPEMRGSSPLNWSLIKGLNHTKINVIKITKEVDGGEILSTKKIKININSSIEDLHVEANKYFPKLLENVLDRFKKEKKIKGIKQSGNYSYYPRRFKEDGFILFDQNTAKQIHNKIRALSDPYPNAFSFFNKKKINFKKSTLLKNKFFGEPGKIYQIDGDRILICALDLSLWIYTDHKFKKSDRYKKLTTINEIALKLYEN